MESLMKVLQNAKVPILRIPEFNKSEGWKGCLISQLFSPSKNLVNECPDDNYNFMKYIIDNICNVKSEDIDSLITLWDTKLNLSTPTPLLQGDCAGRLSYSEEEIETTKNNIIALCQEYFEKQESNTIEAVKEKEYVNS